MHCITSLAQQSPSSQNWPWSWASSLKSLILSLTLSTTSLLTYIVELMWMRNNWVTSLSNTFYMRESIKIHRTERRCYWNSVSNMECSAVDKKVMFKISCWSTISWFEDLANLAQNAIHCLKVLVFWLFRSTPKHYQSAAGCKHFWLLMMTQIQYWRLENPRDVRSMDIIVGPPTNPCPAVNISPEQRRRREVGSPVRGAVNDLWPYSTIRAGVLVLNLGSEGSLSDTIDFHTPQGGNLPYTCNITPLTFLHLPLPPTGTSDFLLCIFRFSCLSNLIFHSRV